MLDSTNVKDERIRLIEEFYSENRRLPKLREIYKGERIGYFLNNIKNKKIKITEEQMKKLEKIGFSMEVNVKVRDNEKGKEYKIGLVEEFYSIYGRLPMQKERYKEVELGNFLNNIKEGNTTITEEQIKRLTKLGFSGEVKDKRTELNIRRLEKFYWTNNRLPKENEKIGRANIGEILISIRAGKIRITEEQFIRLQNIDTTLTRGQVSLIEKKKTYVKK
ncbi:MAG: hypothetical protein HFH31_02135 [Bacilli bacterium]|nr:hypothetical protein [Bacilli bacterium]